MSLLAMIEGGVEICEDDEDSCLRILGGGFEPKIGVSREQIVTRLAMS